MRTPIVRPKSDDRRSGAYGGLPQPTVAAVDHRRSNPAVQHGPEVSRVLDLFLAILLLIVALPVLAIAALALKLEAPGAPVLFRQTRYGYAGQPFTIIKLRTMVPNAEALKASLVTLSQDKGPGFKLDHDPRVTRVGAILRRVYIDEIPQFVNVIRGDMAIVGPRANSYAPAGYEPWQRIRLIVKPGITGTWQVAKLKPVSFDDRCLMDLDYVRRKAVAVDLGIIMQTVVMILTRASGC